MLGFTQIGGSDPGWISLSTCATDGDQPELVPSAIGDDSRLGAKMIGAINNKVIGPIQCCRQIVWCHKIFNFVYLTVWINGQDPLMHGRDLGFAELTCQGVDLSINIRFRDIIQIDQGDPADAAARQRLCRP